MCYATENREYSSRQCDITQKTKKTPVDADTLAET